MALDPNDASAAPDRTTDLPAPPAAPDTARGADTSVVPSPSDETRTAVGPAAAPAADGSAETGGYTPAPAAAGPPTRPTIPGYEILGLLGRGGMGVVFKARQVALDRVVALKMVLAGPQAAPSVLARFRAEALAVARLQHPNIVQVFEVGEVAGLPFFSLEFVDGGTLSKKIAHEPQPPRFAAETVRALARAVQYAHDRGVVHRDLKPANVLLAPDGTPKITDFGLAKRLETDSAQTQTGAVLGTPSYMAPEQASGDTTKVGPAVDGYALGAMLYDLLTGRPPFAGTSVLDTLEMVRTREPVPPGQLAGKLPRDLETITLKCLEKDPARRYVTAGELADDLGRFLAGQPIVARPVSTAGRAWRWAKRNPWVAGLGTAVAILLVAVAVLTSLLSWRLNVKKNEAEANARAAQAAEEREANERRRNSEQRLALLDSVRGVQQDVGREMRGRQSLAGLRLRIQERMLKDLDKIRDLAAHNTLDDRAEATAADQMGDVYLEGNRVEDAARQYRRAHAVLAASAEQNPNDPVAKRNLAAITNKLGDAELRLGDAPAARDRYAAALKLREEWAKMVPDHADAQRAVAISHGLLGGVNLVLGEPAAALEQYRAADAEYANLPKPAKVADEISLQRARIAVRERLGECLYRLGQSGAAEKAYQGAYADRLALVKAYPQWRGPLGRDVAYSQVTLGDFYLFDRHDSARALAEYGQVYPAFRDRAAADRDDLQARRELSTIQYRVAVTLGRLADAIPSPAATALRAASALEFAECLRLRTELAKVDREDTHAQIDLLVAQARSGKTADVQKTADGLLKQAPKDRRVLFQVACGLAIAGGGSGPAAAKCRDDAFRVLGQLVDEGWKDRVALETDPDLDAVRGDKRFAALTARLPR